MTQFDNPIRTLAGLIFCASLLWHPIAPANAQSGEKAFRQLEDLWPTPNAARAASGAPGHGYWQQQANYDISVELDDAKQRIIGSERIVYLNRSPDTLTYLWVQLEPNQLARTSDANAVKAPPNLKGFSFNDMKKLKYQHEFDSALTVKRVADANGNDLKRTIVKTMMRVDLPTPLGPGDSTVLDIDWEYFLPDATLISTRSGFEYFPEDDNYIYEVAHWFPRMAAYTDNHGWHNKQFLGSGEFTLEFGDYRVRITAPEDHLVAATGSLQNAAEVLNETQRNRLKKASDSPHPVYVVTAEEALSNQSEKSTEKKTWIFHANRVRDFAFASSRKFIWDAQGYDINGNRGMAMSFYPNEAEPLWGQYSTRTIVHTLEVYSKFTVDYPYPAAISVNGPVRGMEYPMICFNGPRPVKDGTYWGDSSSGPWRHSKYGLISVIIHEVGHNFFPMLINSDERQWTWMDEGLNTFVQFLAEQEWEENYPSGSGEPRQIVNYMKSQAQTPIMSNSESILQFGPNAYHKPATALNVLRETVLGRELFDFAFQEYCRRWLFKRPQPADFFRTMEDASGIDLDWFWRGWFYGTGHVDIAVDNVRRFRMDSLDPEAEKSRLRQEREDRPKTISELRNRDLVRRLDSHPELKDFYNQYDRFEVTDKERKDYQKLIENLEKETRELLDDETFYYRLRLRNLGGVVMPVILNIHYTDGSEEIRHYPAELWRRNSETVSLMLALDREIAQLELDPHLQTADANRSNNYYPRNIEAEGFKLKKNSGISRNPMQRAVEKRPSENDESP